MDAVKAHVAGTDDAHHGVEVRAVVIAQTAGLVHDFGDLKNVLVKDADRIGVGEHETRRVGTDRSTQRVKVDAAVAAGGDIYDLEAAHGSRCRVRAVGRVRNDDLRARGVAAVDVISLDEHDAGKLAVRARRRLERDGVHAEDLGKLGAEDVIRLQRTLYRLNVLQRVELRKAGQRRHVLVDLGVVLHRAGAKRIEAVIHAVNALAKRRIVAGQLVFGNMRQMQRRFALFAEREVRNVARGHEAQTAPLRAQLKNKLHR